MPPKVVSTFSQVYSIMDDGTVETGYTPKVDVFPVDETLPPEKPADEYVPIIGKEVGITKPRFWCGFNDPERIDLVGRPVKGKTSFTVARKGNIFGATQPSADRFSFGNGTLRSSGGPANYNMSFISTWKTGADSFEGFAFNGLEGGWYIEARLKHGSPINGKFFALWSMDLRHLYGFGGETSFLEPDFYEDWPSSKSPPGDPLFATHRHFRDGQGRMDRKMSPPRNRESLNNIKQSPHDPSKWFTVGYRAMPSGGKNVTVENFIDNQKVAEGTRPWLDDWNAGTFPIMFGGAPEFEVDYIWAGSVNGG